MTSILLAAIHHADSIDHRLLKSRNKMPTVVSQCGILSCLAPRIQKSTTTISNNNNRSTTAQSVLNLLSVLSKADTWHLTLFVDLGCASFEDEECSSLLVILRSLTQLHELRGFVATQLRTIRMLPTFASTLATLHAPSVSYVQYELVLPVALEQLHNVVDLSLPFFTEALAVAIPRGPGRRLRRLRFTLDRIMESSSVNGELNTLFEACPEILELQISVEGVTLHESLLPAIAKLRYLQILVTRDALLLLENSMVAFSNLHCLRQLTVSERLHLSAEAATLLARTVGRNLTHLRFACDAMERAAFVTLCRASSFPLLEELKIESALSTNDAEDDENDDDGFTSSNPHETCLPPFLREFTVGYQLTLTPRIVQQLFRGRQHHHHLTHIGIEAKEQRRRNRDNASNSHNDEGANNNSSGNDTDWFGLLIQNPIRRLSLTSSLGAVAMAERIHSLSATLTHVCFTMSRQWLHLERMLSAMFSTCQLLQTIHVFRSYVEDPPLVLDTSVAFVGLRNNQALRDLTIYVWITDPIPIFNELVAMDATSLEILVLGGTSEDDRLSAACCLQLGTKFPNLKVFRDVDSRVDSVVTESFPLVSWRRD